MRPLPAFLLVSLGLLIGAAGARADDNPDFPQVRPASNGGAVGSDPNGFQAIQPQTNHSPTGSPDNDALASGANAERGEANEGGEPHKNRGRVSGVTRGRYGSVLQNGGGDSSEAPPVTPDPVPGPMSLDDIRANFTTVVETYVETKSPKGYWPYLEKAKGKKPKAWRLTKPVVKDASVKKVKGQRYSGLVKFRDARGVRPPALNFVVDFSGADWSVVSVTPAAAPR
ncbi:MAG: hypothetical protein KGJ84_06350 [Elusimicrobia bacterium]|nr:hypothetical protein [Elusimicrobiota bacterium]